MYSSFTSIVNQLSEELKSFYDSREVKNITLRVLEYVTNRTRKDWMMQDQYEFSEDETNIFSQVLEKLRRGVPLQYAIGEADFMGDIYYVGESVLIPRPETEELVHWILEENAKEPRSIMDIGTGSGCIPISLAKARPNWRVMACDVSNEALVVARRNARELKTPTEITFYKEDILNPQTVYSDELDIIVSNPPYVLESDKHEMSAHVLDHEPNVALFVPDSDPLKFYRAIGQYAMQALKSGGKLYFEIHTEKGGEVVQLLEKMGYTDVNLQKDLSERDRMVSATTT